MQYFSPQQMEHFFQFMDTLDCYLATKATITEELTAFENNPNRLIASFVYRDINQGLVCDAPYIKMLYVLSGQINAVVDSKESACTAGSLIIANQFTKISYEEVTENTIVLSFYFKQEYFTDSLLTQLVEETKLYRFFVESSKASEFENHTHYFQYHFDKTEDLYFYAMLLLKQIVKMNYFDNKLTRSAFVLFIIEVSHLSKKTDHLDETSDFSNVLMTEILTFIENNLKSVSLSDLAKEFHFHPNYLSSFIKIKTNRGFSEWLTFYRLFYAKNYLSETDLPIKKIIEEIGYQDKTTFYKLFKEKYGMTPGAYRKGKTT